MMCFAWTPKSSCQMAEYGEPRGCPTAGWWWALAAGAGLLLLAGKRKQEASNR